MVGVSKMKVGDKFGRLTVIELVPHRKNPKAVCRCDCGETACVQRGSLKNGHSRSCGCLKAEITQKRLTTHGGSQTNAYSRWNGILDRCKNPKNAAYPNYGGRGISVKWASFEDFYADMGNPPPGSWLERLDNNGPYSRENCAWVSPRENSRNKRVSKRWTVNGKTYGSSVDAAIDLGVNPSVIVRGCNGFTRYGRWHPPRQGWSCVLKYDLS